MKKTTMKVLTIFFASFYILLTVIREILNPAPSLKNLFSAMVAAVVFVCIPLFLSILLSRQNICEIGVPQGGTIKGLSIFLGIVSLITQVYFAQSYFQLFFGETGLFFLTAGVKGVIYGVLQLLTFWQIGELEAYFRGSQKSQAPFNNMVNPYYPTHPLQNGNPTPPIPYQQNPPYQVPPTDDSSRNEFH